MLAPGGRVRDPRRVNFYAHAFLAAERRDDAAFVLGAMLPDLCGFAGERLGEAPAAALGDGVRFHHETDAAFHATDAFTRFCSELSALLQARGVRRGPARGVAHVAGELLLDGWLAREAAVPSLYRRALGDARALLAAGALACDTSERVTRVCARLHAAPLPESYTDAAFVCERIERALAARPYLALATHELEIVHSEVVRAARETRWVPSALERVRRALEEAKP